MLTTPERPDVFVAISHRGRRQMLDLLREQGRSVTDIAAHFAMSRPAVSQHLRVLLDAGLVTEERHGRERRYQIIPDQLGPVRAWIGQYEHFWDDHLGRLQMQLAKGMGAKNNEQNDPARLPGAAATGAGVAGPDGQRHPGGVDVPQ